MNPDDDLTEAILFVLLDIHQELALLRQSAGIVAPEEDDDLLFCTTCAALIPEDSKVEHATAHHNWHSAMGDDLLNQLYVHDPGR
jgi:Co/Zn/Cd efflux system component